MAITYTQTDTVAPLGVIQACSPVAPAADADAIEASVGGTAGSGPLACDVASQTSEGCFEAELAIDDGDSLDAGTLVMRVNVSSAQMGLQMDEIYVCRVNSSGVSQETLGSVTGLATDVSAGGIFTQNITLSAASAHNAGDRVYVMVVFFNSDTMVSRTVTVTPSEDIDTPFTAAAGGTVHELSASPAGTSTTVADVFRKATRFATAAGIAAVTATMSLAGGVTELTAQADGSSTAGVTGYIYSEVPSTGSPAGTSTASADMQVVRALDTQADGTSTSEALITVEGAAATELTTQSDGVSTASADLDALRIRSAQADGVGSASADLSRIRSLSAASGGVGSASVDADSVRALTAQADGVSTTSALPQAQGLSAQADGTSTSGVTAYIYSEVPSAGDPAGTSTATALIQLAGEGPTELTAQADGVGSATATLYARKAITGGSVAGTSTATAIISVAQATSLTAQADGVGAASVDMDAVRALTAGADGSSTATAAIATGGQSQLTVTSAGMSTASAEMDVVRSLQTSASGTSAASTEIAKIAARSATASGTSSASADLDVVRALSASSDGSSTASADLDTVGAYSASAAGVGTASVTILKLPTDSVLLEPPFDASLVDPARDASLVDPARDASWS